MTKKRQRRVRKGGRPVNLDAPRLHVLIARDVKYRANICAAMDGVSFHNVVDAALRAYLDKRGIPAKRGA